MLTVKHVMDSGDERVFLAKAARYSPAGITPNSSQTPETVWCLDDADYEFPLTGGVVYVMNDNGATVAKYSISQHVPLAA